MVYSTYCTKCTCSTGIHVPVRQWQGQGDRAQQDYSLACLEASWNCSGWKWTGTTLNKTVQKSSVADPGCLSRIPDPDFTHPGSRISVPMIQIQLQKRGVKKNLLPYVTFFYSHKFNKIVNYLMFEMLNKKIWANFQRITGIELFTQKIVTRLSKICVWDPGSGIRDPGSGKNLFRIPDPGVKRAPDPGSGSATLQKRLCKKCITVLPVP